MSRSVTIGIACPECGEARQQQVDSRETFGGRNIRRRYECAQGHRFTTYEQQADYARPPLPWIPDYQI